MRTSLVTDALQMGPYARLIAPAAIFHSDHETKYTSAEFAGFCAERSIRVSLGRTGVCWDDAGQTVFTALENEVYNCEHFAARARFAVANHIEAFCNRQRRHSTLGYRTPFETPTNHHTGATAS